MLRVGSHQLVTHWGNISVYWGFWGITEKNMETTKVYWGFIGMMAKKMEASSGV